MANNHNSDSENDSVIPLGIMSDSENSVNNEPDEEMGFNLSDLSDFETDSDSLPDSPMVLDPYVNPNDVTEISGVLEQWKVNMSWPQYEQQPFEPRDFPITREPPHHTVPLLVAKVHEIEGNLALADYNLDNKAAQSSVVELEERFNNFGLDCNENFAILENMQGSHNTLLEKLETTKEKDDRKMKKITSKLVKMGKKIAILESLKPSTSGVKKRKFKKK